MTDLVYEFEDMLTTRVSDGLSIRVREYANYARI